MGVRRMANYKYFYGFNNPPTYAAAGRDAEISAISISRQASFWATTSSCLCVRIGLLWKTTCWALSCVVLGPEPDHCCSRCVRPTSFAALLTPFRVDSTSSPPLGAKTPAASAVCGAVRYQRVFGEHNQIA